MISKKTKYGLRALIYLAKEYQKGPVLISEIATKEKMPQKFLEFILLDLKKNGILESKKGKGGGYFLAMDPKKTYLGNIVRVLDGPLAPVSCVSQTAYRKCDDCLDENCCGIKFIMKDVRDAIANILDKTTLEDVLSRVNSAQTKEALSYVI